MTAGLDHFLSQLQRVKQTGDGEWTASCPAPGHGQRRGDIHPSLSINRGNGAGPLLNCHAECRNEDILAGVGMSWRDFHSPKEAIRRKSSPATSRIVATYDYTDDAGVLQYQGVRYEPKDFKQRRPDPDRPGEWIWNLKGIPRVLYRLPELKKAIAAGEMIYIVEGEKDVDNLRTIGIAATCNVGGAGKWKPEYSNVLRGATVIVIPDNDKVGRDHATQVYDALRGIAEYVRIVPLPGIPEKGDVSDWIAAGGTREQLKCIVAATVTTTVTEEPVALYTRCAADVEMAKVEWLWPARLPIGKIVAVAGDPGLGKSCATNSMAATVSKGGRWPVSGGKCDPAGVLIASFEDDPEDVTVPRLVAAGADLRNIHFLEGVPGEEGRRSFDVTKDTDRLDVYLERNPGIRLAIIDPISATMPGTDSHKNADVRSALNPLREVARRRRVCVVTVTHLNKGTGSAMHRVIGSIAFAALARVVFAVARDEQDPDGRRRLMVPIKNNLGDDRSGLSYTMEQVNLPGGIETVRIVWGTDPVAVTADKALTRDEERGAGRDAEAFLRDILAGGPVPVPKIMDEAKKACVAERTLRRVKDDLGVKATKTGMSGGWSWELPTGTAWGTL